jgi:hypothetical protein
VSSPGDPNSVTGNGPAAVAALRPHDRRDPWLRTGPKGVRCGVGLVIPLARPAALLFTAGLCLIQPAKASAARLARGRTASRIALSMKCLPCPVGTKDWPSMAGMRGA